MHSLIQCGVYHSFSPSFIQKILIGCQLDVRCRLSTRHLQVNYTLPWCLGMNSPQCCPTELCVIMQMFYIRVIQYGGHQPGGHKHLKSTWCKGGTEFSFLFDFNQLKCNDACIFYQWLSYWVECVQTETQTSQEAEQPVTRMIGVGGRSPSSPSKKHKNPVNMVGQTTQEN